MASNELAAILARRRAKAGGESDPPAPAVERNASPAPESTPAVPRSSIAERIARLKQQSAAASAAEAAAAPAPIVPRLNHSSPASEPSEQLQASSSSVGSASDSSVASAASEPVDTSAVAAAQEAAGIRKASSKIQHLQGSLGINVNPFGRPGGPPSRGYQSGQRESIMSTGEEQYGYTQHAMGVAMPGMTGSAIPMPGLAKGGFRLPGMAARGENAEAPAAGLDDSHATMNRVAGPKRRGPTRPPPGAFRIPTMAAPIIDNVEPAQAPAAPASAEIIEPKAREAPVLESPPAPASLFASQASVSAHTSAPIQTPMPVPSPATPAVPATLHKLPEPEVMPPMKPYQIEDDDPYAPKYETPVEQPYAPTGFPSALLANFSMDELTLDDKPNPKPAAMSTPSSTSALSLFGVSSTPAQVPESSSKPSSPPPAVPVEALKPAREQMSTLMKVETPVPTHDWAPTPTQAPAQTAAPALAQAQAQAQAPVPVVSTPAPALSATAPASASTTDSYLFGAVAVAALDDDDSSESDWSGEDNHGGSQSLFGTPNTASKPEAAASSPVLVASPLPTPELHQAPVSMSNSLFGGPSSPSASAVAPAGFVHATPQTTTPPTPYSSLFSGAVSSSSESESDSDEEGGLFGTGVPSKR